MARGITDGYQRSETRSKRNLPQRQGDMDVFAGPIIFREILLEVENRSSRWSGVPVPFLSQRPQLMFREHRESLSHTHALLNPRLPFHLSPLPPPNNILALLNLCFDPRITDWLQSYSLSRNIFTSQGEPLSLYTQAIPKTRNMSRSKVVMANTRSKLAAKSRLTLLHNVPEMVAWDDASVD